MNKRMVVMAMDLTWSAPCPECGSEAEWSQEPARFFWGAVGQYGFATETVVRCEHCGLESRELQKVSP
jgi:uncharacterized Zn finger protein